MAGSEPGRGSDNPVPATGQEGMEPLCEEQVEPSGIACIGELLRSRREELGLSLSDVQSATKIRRRYLEALETGEETVSPGEVYFRGFLKIYGNYLGLDGVALVEQYKAAKEGRAVRPVQEPLPWDDAEVQAERLPLFENRTQAPHGSAFSRDVRLRRRGRGTPWFARAAVVGAA
ncbi:MAG: helix-turn-helix domain-containing protein, partial [Firmicutes bacterium]|nr:helix-turn-helix domain-containing protein [Bacillota bacterium]